MDKNMEHAKGYVRDVEVIGNSSHFESGESNNELNDNEDV